MVEAIADTLTKQYGGGVNGDLDTDGTVDDSRTIAFAD